jgi:hypothetical protein
MWAGFECGLAVESIEEVAGVATAALRGEIATTAPHQRACKLNSSLTNL